MRINKISAKMIKGCDAEAACRELSEYYDIIRHESGSGIAGTTIEPVSYTHLDVYKRQAMDFARFIVFIGC